MTAGLLVCSASWAPSIAAVGQPRLSGTAPASEYYKGASWDTQHRSPCSSGGLVQTVRVFPLLLAMLGCRWWQRPGSSTWHGGTSWWRGQQILICRHASVCIVLLALMSSTVPYNYQSPPTVSLQYYTVQCERHSEVCDRSMMSHACVGSSKPSSKSLFSSVMRMLKLPKMLMTQFKS